MNFNIYNSLILAGIIQGIIFISIVIFSKKYKNISTYFLITLIGACVYNNIQYYLSDTGILTPEQMFGTIYLPIASLSPVLIYYYVLKFLKPKKTLSKKNKWLLIFFVFFTISIIPYKIAVAIDYKNNAFYLFYLMLSNFHEFFSIVLNIILIIFSFKKVKEYEQNNTDFNQEKISHSLKWLKTTLIIFIILTILWLVLMIRTVVISNHVQSFYLLWIGISFLTYWLGYIGIYKYGVTEQRKKIRSYSNSNTPNYPISTHKNNYIKKLDKLLIKNKGFLNPNLTLDIVAKKINVSKSHLSKIINSELDSSFTDYINGLRIEQTKNYLENTQFSNYTLEAIGLEAGFNSKSTFNKAFKKHTGLTPSEYKKTKIT